MCYAAICSVPCLCPYHYAAALSPPAPLQQCQVSFYPLLGNSAWSLACCFVVFPKYRTLETLLDSNLLTKQAVTKGEQCNRQGDGVHSCSWCATTASHAHPAGCGMQHARSQGPPSLHGSAASGSPLPQQVSPPRQSSAQTCHPLDPQCMPNPTRTSLSGAESLVFICTWNQAHTAYSLC